MGTYLVRVSEMKDGNVVNSQNTGAVASYSPEYKDIEPNLPLLKSLATATGGEFDPEPAQIAAHGEAGVWRLQALWRSLVLLAILLFFLDVALRRIAVSREQISRLRTRFRPSEDKESPVTETGTLESLRHRKEGIWGKSVARSDIVRERRDAVQRGEEARNKNISISPSPHPGVPPPAEPAESHTSRLLKAKKRAEQSKN